MTAIDPVIDKALDRLAHAAATTQPDWPQVTGRLGKAGAPPRDPLRWQRSYANRFVAAASLAAAAAVILLVGLPRGGHVSVTDRALAAVGSGPVVHLIQPSPDPNQAMIDIASGAETIPTRQVEMWIDASRGVIHELDRVNAAIVADDLLTPKGTYSWESGRVLPPSPRKYLAVPPALRGFATGYRDALASGAATIDRTGMLNDRPVYWLRFKARNEADRYTRQVTHYVDEVAVDRDSYKPVAVRTRIGGQAGPLTPISLIENVSRDDANLEQPSLSPMARGEDVLDSRPINAGEAAQTLGATPLWAGRSIAGLGLSGIYEQSLKTWYPQGSGAAPVFSRGLVFVYDATPGDLNHGSEFLPRGSIAIRESTKQEGFYGWQQNPPLPAPPAGEMRKGGPYYLLKAGGLYLSIEAGDKDTALTVARTLTD
jgi:hypothetical protein